MSQPTLAEAVAAAEAARSEALALLEAGSHEDVKSKFLSRKGRFRELQELLGKLSAADRPTYGQAFHAAKSAIEQAYEAAAAGKSTAKSNQPIFDLLPGQKPAVGSRHPLVQTIQEIGDIFGRMGFSRAEGPEIEDVFHNFIALNIPDDHPARDPRDNFFIRDDLLVRSQTSTIQIRVMEKQKPPIRVYAIGRVYRPDAADATHSPMFHQVEGLVVDEGITMAHLKTVVRMFTQAYLGEHVRIRFRPSFFPFTEPSIEVDMSWGESNDRWIELGGAGMVDPAVFEAVGYDPERYTGFAFGLGVERLAMRRHNMTDLRPLFESDVRFLKQFA